MPQINITEIVVGDRRREDMGDISGLADSIATYGLLHPVVIDEQKRLVAGGRRLTACKSLGWRQIPVTFLRELTEKELRAIEIEENIKRKDLTPIEMSRQMKELAGIKADELKANSTKVFCPPSGQNLGGRPETPDNIRNIADSMGVSKSTLSEAIQHVQAVDKYPVLEELPKKQAIQTARQLDKLPEEEKPVVLHSIQEKQQKPTTDDDELKAEQMRKAERFNKSLDALIARLHGLSGKEPSFYFEGFDQISWAINSVEFFAENKLGMIDNSIEWLQKFREEFKQQMFRHTGGGFRRVK